MRSLKLSFISLLLLTAAAAGINWKAVWIEQKMLVLLTVGEAKPYTVMGLTGTNVRADLTAHPDLLITSSDPAIVEVDREHVTFVGKKPGHAEIRISFSEATAIVQAFVKE